MRNGESELVNTNKLVRFYEGTTGLKTGTTSTAGYCLSATAQRNGMELAAVVMGGDTSNDRFNGAKKLLDYGFANYTFSKVDANLDEDIAVEIDKGTEKELTLDAKGTVNLLMKKNEAKEITRKTVLNEGITAPVKKGDVLGEVEIYVGEEKMGSIPLTASKDIDKISFLTTMGWIIKSLFIL